MLHSKDNSYYVWHKLLSGFHSLVITVVSQAGAHGHLNIANDFGPHTQDIRLYRSCYVDPLKYGTWALTREWMLALDTVVTMKIVSIGSV